MKTITWLASFPKSGNTWFRAFLANLLNESGTAVDINRLQGFGPIASARSVFDLYVGYESGLLRPDEIERLRPEVYRFMAEHEASPLYLKVHDAYTYLPDGRPLFPPEATKGAVYILRNPLDVCVSYKHYFNMESMDVAVRAMASSKHMLSPQLTWQREQLPQRLLSWSEHVLSWTEAPLPLHVVRYEDMKVDPLGTFAEAARFLELPHAPERVAAAVRNADFSKLRRQEREGGFKENLNQGVPFFREGRSGGWRDVLTDAQVERLIEDHRAVMQRFGYLSTSLEPVY